MSQLRVIPIIEGQGEENSVRILLERLWYDELGGEYIEILRPIRQKRQRLAKEETLIKAVQLARGKLKSQLSPVSSELILVLVDADEDPPCLLAPEWLRVARAAVSDVDIACVFPNPEFETWFVAAAESLGDVITIPDSSQIPSNPDESRSGKRWIISRFRGTRYSPTVDQPKLTAAIDLELCRNRSPSFDKLCRELEKWKPKPADT